MDTQAQDDSGRSSLVSRLADQLAGKTTAAAVYGAPVERDGVTVVPVAKVRFGFGGGAGTRSDQRGEGGGGGAVAVPIGYIELKGSATAFRKITTSSSWMGLLLAGGAALFLALKGAKALTEAARASRVGTLARWLGR